MDILPSLTKVESAEQIIYPAVEIEPPQITSPTDNDTPEATPGVCRSSQVRVKTEQDYIPSMSGKKYETVNTLV